MMSTEAESSFSCASTPNSASRMCREYRSSCSSVTDVKEAPRCGASSRSVLLDHRHRRGGALRGGERLALQELQRLLELEVLVRGELERCRGLVVVRAGLAGGARSLVAVQLLDALVLVVEQVLLEIHLAQAPGGGRGGILDHEVGLDALRLDRAPARRVIARRRQLDRGVVAERQDRLN